MPVEVGTTMQVLRIKDFRRIFLASFTSSIGRWMQNVALGVFAYELTDSARFTTFIVFAQLFPLLSLSLLGGSLADTVDRRLLLIVTQSWQAVWGLILAWQVTDEQIGKPLLVFIVLMIGIGQALFAPAFTAVVPSLVGPKNLTAAISLNSMQVNLSRVVGPVIGALLLGPIGLSGIFVINSLTYGLIILVLAITRLPLVRSNLLSPRDRFFGGLRLARAVPQVGRPLLVMTAFSILCLPFIGLMPVLAERRWGIDAKSTTYGVIYACFGVGNFFGALGAGTVLLRVPKQAVVRISLSCFAVAIAVLSQVTSAGGAAVVLFFVGLSYFIMPTALSTFLQEHLTDEVRGRVMALWILSFGGVISLTNLVSGALVEATSTVFVLMIGAVSALVLAFTVRLEPGDPVGDSVLDNAAT